MAGYRTNIHGKFTLCVWTLTEKEQEELGSAEDGFSERKNPPEVPSGCLSVPLGHSGSASPVLRQECAWFGEEHTVPLGSLLALPYSSAQGTDPTPRLLGKEAPRRAGGPQCGQGSCSGTWDNIPFPLWCLWPFPK